MKLPSSPRGRLRGIREWRQGNRAPPKGGVYQLHTRTPSIVPGWLEELRHRVHSRAEERSEQAWMAFDASVQLMASDTVAAVQRCDGLPALAELHGQLTLALARRLTLGPRVRQACPELVAVQLGLMRLRAELRKVDAPSDDATWTMSNDSRASHLRLSRFRRDVEMEFAEAKATLWEVVARDAAQEADALMLRLRAALGPWRTAEVHRWLSASRRTLEGPSVYPVGVLSVFAEWNAAGRLLEFAWVPASESRESLTPESPAGQHASDAA